MASPTPVVEQSLKTSESRGTNAQNANQVNFALSHNGDAALRMMAPSRHQKSNAKETPSKCWRPQAYRVAKKAEQDVSSTQQLSQVVGSWTVP
jgi:hypothetical protein